MKDESLFERLFKDEGLFERFMKEDLGVWSVLSKRGINNSFMGVPLGHRIKDDFKFVEWMDSLGDDGSLKAWVKPLAITIQKYDCYLKGKYDKILERNCALCELAKKRTWDKHYGLCVLKEELFESNTICQYCIHHTFTDKSCRWQESLMDLRDFPIRTNYFSRSELLVMEEEDDSWQEDRFRDICNCLTEEAFSLISRRIAFLHDLVTKIFYTEGILKRRSE